MVSLSHQRKVLVNKGENLTGQRLGYSDTKEFLYLAARKGGCLAKRIIPKTRCRRKNEKGKDAEGFLART